MGIISSSKKALSLLGKTAISIITKPSTTTSTSITSTTQPSVRSIDVGTSTTPRTGGITIYGGGGSSGGGGTSTTQSVSGVIQQPTTTYDPARDVPVTKAPSYAGVVSAQTIGNSWDYSKNILRQDLTPKNVFRAGESLTKTGYTSVKDFFLRRDIDKEKKLEEEARGKLKTTTYIPAGEGTIPAGASFQQGTAEISITDTPTNILLRDATLGDSVSLVAAGMRAQKDLDIKSRTIETEERNADTQKLTSYANIIQTQINTGAISYEEGKKQLEDYAGQLDNARYQRVSEQLTPIVASYQSTLDRAASRGQLTRIVLTTAASVGAGFIGGAVFTALPKGVGTAMTIGTGGIAAYQGTKLGMDVATGKAGALDVAGFVLPLAGFITGAGLYARIGKVDPAKLDAALKTIEVRIKEIKGITQESQIQALHLPEGESARLLGELKMGRRISITEYKLDNLSPESRAILQKAYPNLKLQSFEVTDTFGNTIRTKNLVRIETGKGFYTYRDFTAGTGEGTYNPATKTATIDTLFARGRQGRPTEEFFKERQIIKLEKNLVKKTEEGIFRGTQARAYTFEGARVKGTPEKPITFKDLTEVAEAEKFGRYPSTKTKVLEVSELKNVKLGQSDILLNEEPIISVRGIEKAFKIRKGAGVIDKFVEPIEFKYSKAMKPFEPTPQDIFKTSKVLEPTGKAKQILKQVNKVEFDIPQLPATDFSKQIKSSIQKLKTDLKVKQPKVSMFDLKGKSVNAELQKVYENNLSGLSSKQVDKLLQKEKDKIDTIFSSGTRVQGREKLKEIVITTSVGVQALNPKQIEKQIAKLSLQPVNPIIPIPIIPRVPIFPFPSSGQGGGSQTRKGFRGRIKKWTPSYAANLASAMVGKAVHVSPQQFKKLVAQPKFTALPVLSVNFTDKERKNLKKVNFGF